LVSLTRAIYGMPATSQGLNPSCQKEDLYVGRLGEPSDGSRVGYNFLAGRRILPLYLAIFKSIFGK